MANIHFKEKDLHGTFINCVFHFPIPVKNNQAGKALKDMLKNGKAPKARMPWNSSQENTKIEAGEIYETIETVCLSAPTLTDAEIIAEVQAAYTAKQARILPELEIIYSLFGKEV